MQLEKFINDEFGYNVRTFEWNNTIYIVAEDVVKSLEYKKRVADVVKNFLQPTEYIHISNKGLKLSVTDTVTLDKMRVTDMVTLKDETKNESFINLDTLGFDYKEIGRQGGYCITEPGFYKLVSRSEQDNAINFQNWVYYEVLPQIRLTGGYIPINSNDTEETINKKAQEIAQSTIKHKDKLLKQLEDAYKKLEFKYEIEQYKSQLYRTERDEAIQECKELEEDINTLKDIAIESLHLHTKIQGTLGLKDIIIKVTGSSHGWQTYRQWMKDKYDNGLLTDCGISYTRYKLCSKEFIIDCDDIRALEVLQEMFNDFYNPSINGMTIEL